MVYLEPDDSSSGEGFAETERALQQQQHNHQQRAVPFTDPYLEQYSRSSSRGGESEASYEDVYSSSEDSYHSECDEIAEYWDPYCEQLIPCHSLFSVMLQA